MTNWKLIIRDDEGATRDVTVPSEGTTIGRHGSNSLVLEGRNVSRFHARVVPRDREVLVVDRESDAGTWIDHALLDGEITLSHGERFGVGSFEIFVVDAAKDFTPPKFAPHPDDEDIDDDGSDDFAPVPIVSASPPVASSREEPTAEPRPHAETDALADDSAPVLEPPRDIDAPVAVPATDSASEANATVESKATAPLPEFKITASTDALHQALARKKRVTTRRHHRLIFLAPEPPREPIGLRRSPIRFGSGEGATVVVAGPGIAAVHATLTIEDGEAVLATAEDGATFEFNGTAVSRAELSPGDKVVIGTTTFVMASRAREYFEVSASRPEYAPRSMLAPPATNTRAWFFVALVLVAGLAAVALILSSQAGSSNDSESRPDASTAPTTYPLADASSANSTDAGVDVLVALPPDEIAQRLEQSQSDVEVFETASALARLAVFHGREDVPVQARVRASMIEMAAYLADGHTDEGRRACAEAQRLSPGDLSFLDHESPRVRALCGLGDAGSATDR